MPQTSKEGWLHQLSSPGERAKALQRALRMVSEKRPETVSSLAALHMRQSGKNCWNR